MYTMHQNLKGEVFSAIMIIPIPRIHTSKKKKKERKKEKEGKNTVIYSRRLLHLFLFYYYIKELDTERYEYYSSLGWVSGIVKSTSDNVSGRAAVPL